LGTWPVLKPIARGGLLVLGVGGLAWMFWAVGWPAIDANLAAIGGWFGALVGLYLLAQLAFMLGWWVVIDPGSRPSSFLRLFGVYLAGDAVNYLVPSANLAGEPVKAHLLRHTVGFGQALTSIAIHKHAELLAQWLFLCGGMVVCLSQYALPLAAELAAAVVIGGLGGVLFFMTWALRKGTFASLLRRLLGWRPFVARLKVFQPSAEALDARIQAFYKTQGSWFFAATGWCLVGWCGGLLETYVILHLLSPHEGWTTAVAVETLAMVLNNLVWFIPGRLGSAEGVRIGVFALLGLPTAQGVAYGLVRRGRELIWTLPGLVVLLRKHAGRLVRLDLPPLASKGLRP